MDITRIYLVTNCYGDPNKVYIGKTKDCREYKHQRKYGKNITYDYIDEVYSFDKKDWEPLETFWIEYFKYLGFEIVNKNIGGGGPIKHSEETKLKISSALKGSKRSDECKLLMSLSKKGKSKPEGFGKKISDANKGNKHSDERKLASSLSRKGKPKPEGFGERISKFKKGLKNPKIGISKYKSILQYDLEGNFIQEWTSTKEASIFFKLTNGTSITRCLKKKSLSSLNYYWVYKENEIINKILIPKGKYNKSNIMQYNLNHDFIKEWNNLTQIKIQLGLNPQSISHNLQLKTKKSQNFIWEYK
jgi:hypothetical protein